MNRSPFPGMDPFLEPHWLDVHTKLVAYSADALNESLPDDLIARSEERVGVETDHDTFREFAPDVRVFEMVGATAADSSATPEVPGLAPYRLVALQEPITERFIEILDSTGQRLITVIEFVSPGNKRGQGLKAFVDKREDFLSGGVNFVEIDLNRSGDWRALLQPHVCPPQMQSPYRAITRIPQDPMAVYLHPISLRQPLPSLKIPLRKGEPPVELALQALVDQAYRNGRYARSIDYSSPLVPSLEAEDATWVKDLLRGADKK